MLKLLLKFRFRELVRRLLSFLLILVYRQLQTRSVDGLTLIKDQITQDLELKLEINAIRYGPFIGLKFEPDSWSRGDSISIQFGLYEQEILSILEADNSRYSHVIVVGAGSGIYGLGILFMGLADYAILFEIDESSRSVIARNSKANQLSEKCEIRAKATRETLLNLEVGSNSLFVIDIEGDEFKILDESFFLRHKSASFIIEIHDFNNESTIQLGYLLEILSKTHIYGFVESGFRDPNKFPELRNLPDNIKWLLMSEGRPKVMKWLHALPILK